MILTCPACATRYRVADREFEGSAGRTVRCANCGHLWYAYAAGSPAREGREQVGDAAGNIPPQSEAPGGTPPLLSAPRIEVTARLHTPLSKRKGRRWPATSRVVTVVLLMLALSATALILIRQFAPMPAASRLYASAAGSGASSQTGLVIQKIEPARTSDGLVVDGEIANPGSVFREVPRLRVALEDSTGKEIRSEIVDPPKTRLAPGETAHFETQFANPPDAATGVSVTFAPT